MIVAPDFVDGESWVNCDTSFGSVKEIICGAKALETVPQSAPDTSRLTLTGVSCAALQ